LIRARTESRIAFVELARLDKKNALTGEMYGQLADAISGADRDPQARVVLLRGAPDCFCAGNDVADFLKRPPLVEGSPSARFFVAMQEIRKPIVAAVGGPAVGIGTTMLLHCDLVYVADDARLAMPFTSLGLVPEFASSLIVPQLMGNARAAEKILLGDPFTGADAVEVGIANAVLPANEVVNHARRIAERFNALPPGAVRDTKKLMRRARSQAALETIAVEGKVFAERLQSPEAKEAFSAFFQKRKPDFSKF